MGSARKDTTVEREREGKIPRLTMVWCDTTFDARRPSNYCTYTTECSTIPTTRLLKTRTHRVRKPYAHRVLTEVAGSPSLLSFTPFLRTKTNLWLVGRCRRPLARERPAVRCLARGLRVENCYSRRTGSMYSSRSKYIVSAPRIIQTFFVSSMKQEHLTKWSN
jgi:hypothetical protein